jgi:EAL domain-containing protein (putative c-di-GMP-specific phosphodiesterase class I)
VKNPGNDEVTVAAALGLPVFELADFCVHGFNADRLDALSEIVDYHAGTELDGVTCAVNVSLRQLAHDGFATRLAAEAAELGVEPGRICIEVTETQRLEADGPARDALIELKAAGFRLALDDFGTGYASLRQLQLIPFDLVKVDRSFTSRIGDGGRGTALCEAALRMAAACGMRVTAEGIETQEQADLLRGMGCDAGQGYLWARPMPAEQALAWLRAQRAGG